MKSQYEQIAVNLIKMYGKECFDGFAHFSAIKGRFYEEQKHLRLMIVGRCTNGWTCMPAELSPSEFGSAMERGFLESDKKGFDWIAADNTNGDGYRLSRSKFWNYTKEVWKRLNEKFNDPPIDLSGCGDRWFEFTVWTNLYKITEQGKICGTAMAEAQVEECREILKEEIDLCKPSIIIMEIGSPWFSDFSDLFTSIEDHADPVVRKTARIGESLVIVTSRPETTSKEEFCSAILRRC